MSILIFICGIHVETHKLGWTRYGSNGINTNFVGVVEASKREDFEEYSSHTKSRTCMFEM